MGDKARDGWEASLTTRRPNATDGKTGRNRRKWEYGLTEPKLRRREEKRRVAALAAARGHGGGDNDE